MEKIKACRSLLALRANPILRSGLVPIFCEGRRSYIVADIGGVSSTASNGHATVFHRRQAQEPAPTSLGRALC